MQKNALSEWKFVGFSVGFQVQDRRQGERSDWCGFLRLYPKYRAAHLALSSDDVASESGLGRPVSVLRADGGNVFLVVA